MKPRLEPTFVGRAEVLLKLEQCIQANSLVLLTGPGGVGKSRLATEWLASQGTPSSVVDLATSDSSSESHHRIAESLGVPSRSVTAETIGTILGERGEFVLLLDNFASPGKSFAMAKEWCDRAPGLRVILTGRLEEDVPAHLVMLVPPLSILGGNRLFRERATDAGADLSNVSEDQLTDLLAPLDGLPLAIELLADRAGLFRFEDLAARVERALSVSPGAALGTRLERVIAFRWDMLDTHQQTLLSMTSVFRGGFTVTDLESVVKNAHQLEHADVPALLADLERSGLILRTRPQSTAPRFAPLRAVATYAGKHSPPIGGLQRAHAQCYATHAADLRPFWEAPDDDNEMLKHDSENMRRAAEYALEHEGDKLLASALYACLGTVRWAWFTGPVDRALALIDQCLERSHGRDGLARLRARVGLWASMFASSQGDLAKAQAYIEQTRGLADALEEPALSGAVDLYHGVILYMMRSLPDALSLVTRGVDRLEHTNGQFLRVLGLANLAMLHYDLGNTEGVRTMLAEARLDSRPWPGRHAHVLQAWANERLQEGDFPSARDALKDSLDIAVGRNLVHVEVRALTDLGALHYVMGDLVSAAKALADAERCARRSGHARIVPRIRGLLACVLLEQGDSRNARINARVASQPSVPQRTSVAFSLIRLGAAMLEKDDEGARILLKRLTKIAENTEDPVTHYLALYARRWADQVQLVQDPHEADFKVGDSPTANVFLCRVVRRSMEATARALGFAGDSPSDASGYLILEVDGHAFCIDGVSQTCAAQNAARALVLLAHKRLNVPGEPIETEALIAGIWPDEVLRGRSGPNRLHVALSKLRALGLKPHLRRKKTAYYLDPSLSLRIVPEGAL